MPSVADNRPRPARDVSDLDVKTLNHCLEDIESFANFISPLKLQIDDLRRNGKTKKQTIKETDRIQAQIPPKETFIDIFRKYRLAFNLIAYLEPSVRIPSPIALIDAVLAPMADILVVCGLGHGDLASRVASPLLDPPTKTLLLTTLKHDQLQLLLSLGEAWTTSSVEWPHEVPPAFHPVFSDGFQPYREAAIREERERNRHSRTASDSTTGGTSYVVNTAAGQNGQQDEVGGALVSQENYQRGDTNRSSQIINNTPIPAPDYDSLTVPLTGARLPEPVPSGFVKQRLYLSDLILRGARVAQAHYSLNGDAPEQLSVQRGEYLEIVNDSLEWWRCRNIDGNIGYVPYTILSLIQHVPAEPAKVDIRGSATLPYTRPLTYTSTTSPAHVTSRSTNEREDGERKRPTSTIMVESQHRSPASAKEINYRKSNEVYKGRDNNNSSSTTSSPIQYQSSGEEETSRREEIMKRISRKGRPMTVDNGVQVNYIPSPPPTPPPPRAHPGTPPTPRSIPANRSLKSPATTNQVNHVTNGNEEETPRRLSHRDKFQEELHATLDRKGKVLKERSRWSTSGQPQAHPITINEHSTQDQVALFLISKGFTQRTLNLLRGQSGAMVLSLTRDQLEEFCGPKEGHRLYSHFLVQKNLSGVTA